MPREKTQGKCRMLPLKVQFCRLRIDPIDSSARIIDEGVIRSSRTSHNHGEWDVLLGIAIEIRRNRSPGAG
jgi:hypothetical protein